jgi:GrpB-like predicted nucleotidyltransferase (UPF0157 family)
MTILLEPYHPRWATQFAQMRQALATALAGLPFDIQHVGSTAVPGLWAKPILDIDLIIADEALLPPVGQRLETLGYQSVGDQGIPGRFAFKPVAATGLAWPRHHLYVCYADSLAVQNHLRFRDALRQKPELVHRYTELKKAIAASPATSREAYTQQKTAFILEVLAATGLGQAALEEIRRANE